jgi:phage terminase small subunit
VDVKPWHVAAARKAWRTRKAMTASRKPIYVTEFGPAMLELTQRQRDFVLAYCAFPQASGTDLARMAGYSGGTGSQGWRSQASRLLRAPEIIAAIHECLTKTYRGRGAAIAQDVMLTIAQDKKHKDQLKAAAMLADRGGFAAMMEQKVTVEHRDQTSEAILNRISLALKRLGLDDPVRRQIEQKLSGNTLEVNAEGASPKEIYDGRADPDQGRALAGPEGNRAGSGSAGAGSGPARPAGPDLDGDRALLPQQQIVRLDQ